MWITVSSPPQCSSEFMRCRSTIYIHRKTLRVCISMGTAQRPPYKHLGENSWPVQKVPLASPKRSGVWTCLGNHQLEWPLRWGPWILGSYKMKRLPIPAHPHCKNSANHVGREALLSWLINKTWVNLPINSYHIVFNPFQFLNQKKTQEIAGWYTCCRSGQRKNVVSSPHHTAPGIPPMRTRACHAVIELEEAALPGPRASPNRQLNHVFSWDT